MERTALLALVDAALSELRELEGDREARKPIDRWSAVTEIDRPDPPAASTDDDLPLLDSGEFVATSDVATKLDSR